MLLYVLGNQCESHSVVSDSLRPHGPYSPWNSPSQNTGAGSCSLLQWIFPTRGSNPGLLHCRSILYQLNHKGNHKGIQHCITNYPSTWWLKAIISICDFYCFCSQDFSSGLDGQFCDRSFLRL